MADKKKAPRMSSIKVSRELGRAITIIAKGRGKSSHELIYWLVTTYLEKEYEQAKRFIPKEDRETNSG